jgi:hypothetical protein
MNVPNFLWRFPIGKNKKQAQEAGMMQIKSRCAYDSLIKLARLEIYTTASIPEAEIMNGYE